MRSAAGGGEERGHDVCGLPVERDSRPIMAHGGVAGASCTLAIDDPTGDIAPLAVATGPSSAEHEGFAGSLVWVGRSDQRHVAGLCIGRVGADRARGR